MLQFDDAPKGLVRLIYASRSVSADGAGEAVRTILVKSMHNNRLAAITAEAMFAGPRADLRGVTEYFVNGVIAIEHERPQTFPVAARHVAGAAQFEQVHRLAVEMADAVLGED